MKNKCKHEGVVGRFGAKTLFCLVCKSDVPNDTWREDREALRVVEKDK